MVKSPLNDQLGEYFIIHQHLFGRFEVTFFQASFPSKSKMDGWCKLKVTKCRVSGKWVLH